ncbi:MAG: hypothetical protein JRG74_15050 [Deltaproteobacteria bacterium]|nr:hypothetical protein [Deltaproteobacteria bacterium]MBW2167345.1 hypothetical protein [Deltaproteobacteria bacterium]
MGIQEAKTPLHWNYFLALEEDLARLSRFIEFTTVNFDCHSIEMARIILTSTSEIDVVAKLLCKKINNDSKASKIHQYRNEINSHFKEICNFKVRIPHYGLELEPWTNWSPNKTPYWWSDYNKIKHKRNDYFEKANLKNALNSVAGLFVLLLYLYKNEAENALLSPNPSLFRVIDKYYRGTEVGGYEPRIIYRL